MMMMMIMFRKLQQQQQQQTLSNLNGRQQNQEYWQKHDGRNLQ